MKPNPQEHQKQIDQAVELFRTWRDSGVTLLDVETTGLEGRVWQLALVDSRTLTPLLAFTCAVGGNWSEVAAEMRDAQGVRMQDFPASNLFADAVEGNLAGRSPVVAWNADFDVAAITRTWPSAEAVALATCAMRAYAPIYGQWSESRQEWKYASLDAALAHEDVDVSRLPAAHSAYGDCVRLAALIEAVAERETMSEQGERMTREDVALYGDGLVGPG